MRKVITVREAARQLNVPVETVHSWMEQGLLLTDKNDHIPWDAFVECLERPEFQDAMRILNLQLLHAEDATE